MGAISCWVGDAMDNSWKKQNIEKVEENLRPKPDPLTVEACDSHLGVWLAWQPSQ